MKCAKYQMLLTRYVDQDVSAKERIEIESHVLTCPACQELLEMLNEESDVLHQVLTTSPLPATITTAILDKLEPFPHPVEVVAKPAVRPARKRQRIAKRAVAVSAALLLTLTAGTFVSPTLAEYVSSFLTRIGGELGVKMAAEQGFSTPVNMEVSSNGYAFRVKDIVADPARMVATFSIEDEKGTVLPDLWIPFYGENRIFITDKEGEMISRASSFSRGDTYADLVFDLDQPPDELVVHFEIKEFGSEPKQVDWSLSVPVDISASKKVSHDLPIGAEYVTPQGIKFNLKSVLYAPSATRLSIATEVTQEAKNVYHKQAQEIAGVHIDDELLARYGATQFAYHLENEHGDVLATSVRGSYDPDDPGHIYLTPAMSEAGEGWHGAFVPIQSTEPLYFVLDSVEVVEPAQFRISFAPQALTQKPVSEEYLGSVYTVKNVEKQTDPQTNEAVLVILLEATMKEPDFNRWTVLDSNGKEYEVETDYAHSTIIDNHLTQTLLVKGMADKPTEMTLVQKSVTKRYTDMNWKAALPKPE